MMLAPYLRKIFMPVTQNCVRFLSAPLEFLWRRATEAQLT
jgi:hypothetical protein